MTTPNADSSRNVTRYLGQNYQFVPSYIHPRDPTTGDIRDPKNQGYYPVTSTWINRTNQNLWALVRIANNLATWILLGNGSSGPLLNIDVPLGVSPIIPDGTGTITFTSTGTTISITGSSASPNNHTINFDTSAAGTVSEVTGDDGVPVLPTLGNINFFGQVVNNSTNSKPLFSINTAVSTETYQIQKTTATATTNNDNLAGIASFDTKYFNVNTNGWVTSKISQLPGSTNIGISYAGGTFTVSGSNGSALSSSNPAYITLQSTTPGLLTTIIVTANQTFTDGLGGNLGTWRCGVPIVDASGAASSDWDEDMPIFLYAVSKSDQSAIAFMISRNPSAFISPVAGQISQAGTILNVSQSDFFSLKAITAADYASQPCICLGSFRMRNVVNAANIYYTVQTLASNDGIGQFNEQTYFDMPLGVNGSGLATYFQNNGGTLGPKFTAASSFVRYQIKLDGFVKINYQFNTATANGTGANILRFTLPYENTNDSTDSNFMNYSDSVGGIPQNLFMGTTNSGQIYAGSFFLNGSAVVLNQNNFNVNDSVSMLYHYKAY